MDLTAQAGQIQNTDGEIKTIFGRPKRGRAKLIFEEKLKHNFANCVAEKLCNLHTEFKRDQKINGHCPRPICFGNVSCRLLQRYNITNCYSMCNNNTLAKSYDF